MMMRERFPIFEKKVYLNSCSQGALSLDVRQAYDRYMADWEERGSPWELWVERGESARSAFAALINASPDEVAVTTSVSASVNALASALRFDGERRKVVISDFEFPTVAQIWHAQALRGAQVVHVPAAEDGREIPLSHFEAAIDEQTALVSIAQVCYRNGSRLDIPGIVEIAHRKGALVLLDSYQAMGTFPIDVRALDVDFLVSGVHKYLLASSGVSFLYVRNDLIPTLNPTVTGWFAQANIFAMDIYAHDPSPTARRFETGTPPVAGIYAALTGMDIVKSVGLANIEAQVRALTGAIKMGARSLGFTLATPEDDDKHGAMIAIRSNDVHALQERLAVANIIVSSRDGNLRVSPHFYNNLDDINCLMDVLQQNRDLLV
jgi:selenocysteine lyase/cysteine desulfurase